jgi:hypothetical protein
MMQSILTANYVAGRLQQPVTKPCFSSHRLAFSKSIHLRKGSYNLHGADGLQNPECSL